jgi:hypothetical protein
MSWFESTADPRQSAQLFHNGTKVAESLADLGDGLLPASPEA